MSNVSVDFHLVICQRFDRFGRRTGKPVVRVAKNKPDCGSDEVAVSVTLALPESLFKRPQLHASIVVPADLAPANITTEVQSNIAQAIADQFGIHMTISAPSNGE